MELEIYTKDVKGIKEAVITTLQVSLPYPTLNKYTFIGVDPGSRNMGIAFLHPNRDYATLYKVEIDKQTDAIKRMLLIERCLQACLSELRFVIPSKAIIEGASYGMPYGQVQLAEVRATIALWLCKKVMNVKIVPPMTIRKQVFGNGKIKNPWDNIDADCAAALGAAYYGYK